MQPVLCILRISTFACSALICSVCFVVPVQSQDAQRVNEIRQQMRVLGRGYSDSVPIFVTETPLEEIIRRQPKSEPLVIALKMMKDETRKITAFCKPDCPPVEMKLLDHRGNVIDEDTDYPALLLHTAERDGDYKLSIQFTGCKTASCDVGVFVRSIADAAN